MATPAPRRPRAPAPTPARTPVGVVAPPAAAVDAAALAHAMRELLAPLAALAVARGVAFATVEELLKVAFVEAANAAHPNLPSHRRVSRISTATGINRREVSRITQSEGEAPAVNRSPATRVFTAWLADPALRTRQGKVKPLPRQGAAPSFEALAHSVTRDVHPRSLLDELVRLGLATLRPDDTVHAARESFVPKGDSNRMLRFLANNVGDHLRAAVGNVLAESPPHLEQAVFADGLSRDSMESFQGAMRTHWAALLQGAVPTLQALIDADSAAGRRQDHRVRVGLYTFHERTEDPPEPDPASPGPKTKPPKLRTES